MNIILHQRCLTWVAGLAFAASLLGQPASNPYTEVLSYNLNQPPDVTAAIEAEVRTASREQLRVIEGKLLKIIQTPEATRDAKIWACRLLRQVGSETAVPVLGPLLEDKDLSHASQFALRSIAGPKVDAVLREALGKVADDLRPGVIQTIGARGDRQAVPLLGPLAGNANAAIAEAALYALGHIGGQEAIAALQAMQVPERFIRLRAHGLLLGAESLLAEGNTAAAASLYRELYHNAPEAVIQAGALRGLIQSDQSQAVPALLAALKNSNAQLRAAAAKFVCETPSEQVLSPVLQELATLSPEVQVTILRSTETPLLLKAARAVVLSADPAVRLAALDALGRLGDGIDVLTLLNVAVTRTGEEQNTARQALLKLRAQEVNILLIASAQKEETPMRVEAIRSLAGRQVAASVPTLLQLAHENDPVVETAAFNALGMIAELDILPEILKFLADARKTGAELAAIAVCRRSAPATAAAVVINALPGPNLPARCALLRILASIPAANAMATLAIAAKDADATVRDIGWRALAEWPDAAALPTLLDLARMVTSPLHRTLALSGYVRLVRGQKATPEARLKMLADTMPVARTPEDRKLIIGALAEVPQTGAVDSILKWLPDQNLEVDVATAVVRIAKQLRKANPQAARSALDKARGICSIPAARQILDNAMVWAGLENIASRGIATSPDGWQKDGDASGDQAGIDGDPNTYWDKENDKPLYRYVVTFKQPEKIAALSIIGWAQENYAPKDFEILCDQMVVQKVENASYDDNFLSVTIPETTCTSVELRITGYYGGSPAIRELGIYRRLSSGDTSSR